MRDPAGLHKPARLPPLFRAALLAGALLLAAACRPKPRLPAPAADLGFGEHVAQWDAARTARRPYAWRRAEQAFGPARSEEIRQKLLLAQFLVMTREGDEEIVSAGENPVVNGPACPSRSRADPSPKPRRIPIPASPRGAWRHGCTTAGSSRVPGPFRPGRAHRSPHGAGCGASRPPRRPARGGRCKGGFAIPRRRRVCPSSTESSRPSAHPGPARVKQAE
jgi:hypothetical protein